jgi:hypothetical protein
MSLKKFQKWIETCPLKEWVELHNDDQFIVIQFSKEIDEKDCPHKLEPNYLPQTSIDILKKKYGNNGSKK